MAYEFKNLNEITAQDAPTENTTVMAFESGSPRQIPAGEFGGKGIVIDLRGYTINTNGTPATISDIAYDPIYESIMTGQGVVFQININGVDVFAEPVLSSMTPGTGFHVILVSLSGGFLRLIFTNGSYHKA